MRVWRVRVRRDNGDSLNWVSAAVRYGGMLLVWGIVLTTLIMSLPHLSDETRADPATVVCGVLPLEILAEMFFACRHSAPQDCISVSHLVILPKPPRKAPALTLISRLGTRQSSQG